MLSTERVLQELNELMGNYERFAQIAVEIPWIQVEEEHESASKPGTYWGFIVDLVHFPEGYVEQNFKEAYVRAVLCSVIDSEEWDKDCFDIPQEERRKCFCNTHSEEMYDGYVNFKEKRLLIRDEEYLRKEINCFAGANDVSLDEQEKYLSYARDAIIVELGGGYSADFTYLVVKDDYIMFIDCGVWD